MAKWLLVYCKPGQDLRAEENLVLQGFDVYRPTINMVKNTSNNKRTVKTESLFPRYIFLSVDLNRQSVAPVRSTFGVAGLVKFGNIFAQASDELIEEIKTSEMLLSIQVGNESTLKQGQEICVNGNGFDNVKAIFCKPCGKERSMILMSILGKQSKVIVATNYIRAV